MVKGIIRAFDLMELCLVIDLPMVGTQVVMQPPKFATRYVCFATTPFIPGSKYLLPAKK